MIKRFSALIKKDIKIAFRNYFFLIVVAVAVLFALLTNYVFPKEINLEPRVFYYIEDKNGSLKTISRIMEKAKLENNKIFETNSINELEEKVENDFNSIGIIIKNPLQKPEIEFVFQGYENQKIRNALLLSLKHEILKNMDVNVPEMSTIILNKYGDLEEIPFNKMLVPAFIVMESILLGYFLIAALIFMEKEEGTNKALYVSPAKITEYLFSKVILMVILGMISCLILTFLTLGSGINYTWLIFYLILGSIAAALLGLILASFFDNISQASVWIIAVSILFSLPFLSYFYPNFAPNLVKVIPTYYLLFATKEIIFPTGNSGIVSISIIGLIIFNIIGFFATLKLYKRSVLWE
ncbi:MAG: ABC transporter permease [Firmicutes bacterium]|jgi:ABC-type multidrug transport system permease subunit|nr:ABC transporter permease [Bacillota bacterium]